MVGLIVTKSKNNVIREEGKDKLDELTINNTVIMDKEFFESIKYPLPNRLNIVISKDHTYKGNNIITVNTLEQALYIATKNAYVIGGYNLFKEAISLVDVMYVTEINKEIDKANDLFPEFNEEEFNKNLVDKNKEYKRYIYTRKNI